MPLFSQLANAVRILSVDAVDKAQSGHPGMPLGMADIATVLFKKFLQYNPLNPHWFNRDRFILSNGHGSMLLYALLHLTGYKVSIDDIKAFRQLHSKTPGHPEYGHTPGVETTTGPLGQGLANAVGMAIAEKALSAEFNQPNLELVDHYTYVFVGDGCLMEGISHEACSLAGTLGLGKLIVLYDDNGISIDGEVTTWFTDDTITRFKAYHWQVLDTIDGHDPIAIEKAIMEARANTTQPTLIPCRTIIGQGTSVAGTEKAHGAPLSPKDIEQLRSFLDWSYPSFEIPDAIYSAWNHVEEGTEAEQRWLHTCQSYQSTHQEAYGEFLRRINGDLPDNWVEKSQELINDCLINNKTIATRKASQHCLSHFASFLPEMLGGSADLTSSNNTDWSGTKPITHASFKGNYLHYGVREFGMSAIMNGLSIHGGFIPYGGTFLVFADYARSAMRLSALSKQRVIYVLTHDSIGLGEDGPTHQPVEHTAMLRITPDMNVWRPADLLETAVAWTAAIENHNGPTCLLLSRQNLKALPHTESTAAQVKRGGYILKACEGIPQAIVIATGSEVEIALLAAERLQKQGFSIQVVSMPNPECFLKQDVAYQEAVLPKKIRTRLAIEAASTNYWYRFVGLDGIVIGIDTFGVSAPANDSFHYFGITVDNVVECLTNKLANPE